MRRSTFLAEACSVLIAAGVMALAPASVAWADGATRFLGTVQPLAGKACGPAADLTVYVQNRELTFVAAPGPMFRGTVQPDGSFRMLPISEATVYRRMLAPPVLEGRVASDGVVGDVTSRWCTYHFVARRM